MPVHLVPINDVAIVVRVLEAVFQIVLEVGGWGGRRKRLEMTQLTPGLVSGLLSAASLVPAFESLAKVVLVLLLSLDRHFKDPRGLWPEDPEISQAA